MLPDIPAFPSPSEQPASDWKDIWVRTLTRPSIQTFEWLANSSGASSRRAYQWVGLTILGCYSLRIGLLSLRGLPWHWSNLVLIVLVTSGALLIFGVSSALIHVIAHALGGVGTYSKLALGLAAFYAPLGGVACFVAGTFVFLPLMVYWLTLHALAVKGVHSLSWGKAILSLAPLLIGIVLLFGGAILVLVLALSRRA